MGTATQRGGVCPICDARQEQELKRHIISTHGSEAYHAAIIEARARGASDTAIGAEFGISFSQLEKLLTKTNGVNVTRLPSGKTIKTLEPPCFAPQTSTVWSFKSRGKWATHDNTYRGNWSPYIPRNIILKYTSPGDHVLDYFSGGGTTAVEAMLLGRRCTACDINPDAAALTESNLDFSFSPKSVGIERIYRPFVFTGDARRLDRIRDGAMDLVCAHPPYAGIVKYGDNIPGDLSDMGLDGFLDAMRGVAAESLRVLRPGGKCAILIGDARANKNVIPVGFETIRVFLEAGFRLKELIIKRQHNCRTTGFWYDRSIQYNFLLLAHEYLPVFEKPEDGNCNNATYFEGEPFGFDFERAGVPMFEPERLETTTVWVSPEESEIDSLFGNLCRRFAGDEKDITCAVFKHTEASATHQKSVKTPFLLVRQPNRSSVTVAAAYVAAARRILETAASPGSRCQFAAFVCDDVHSGGAHTPTAIHLQNALRENKHFQLKEIIIHTLPEPVEPTPANGHMRISHRTVLVYKRIDE